jgi:spermidine synthase
MTGAPQASPPNEKLPTVSLPFALVLIGVTAVIAQIVLLREMIVVFSGNEMSLGFLFASWLIWTAIGSALVGRSAARVNQSRLLAAALEVGIAFVFPATILLVRASKWIVQSTPGEIIGPGPMILTSLLVLSFFCLMSGGLFAAGSRLYTEQTGASTHAGTSNVYLLEAVGSGVGGVAASLILIQRFTTFEIAALLSFLNLLAAARLVLRVNRRRLAVILALACGIALAIFPSGCRWLERISLNRLWHGYHLLANRNSPYGNLAVVQTDGSRSLFENGWVSFNAPDPAAAEEAVHFALLEHPAPKTLLLIGGGLNGSISQALQHGSLERIDYVELDPAVLGLAQEFFPAEWDAIQANPRVHVHRADGRLFLRSTGAKFDVIIVNLPDPQTAQLNRFYTLEFFREAASKLAPSGIFSFQLRAAEDYISPELAEFLRCINKTLRQAFPEVSVIPGETVHFIATASRGILVAGPDELVARLRERNIRTSYVSPNFLPYRMMPDRMLDLESQIESTPETRVNRDFAPIAYYFDVALWSTRFHSGYRHVFQFLAQVRFGPLAASVGLILCAFAWYTGRRGTKQQRTRACAGFCVATMGFTLIGLEMIFLLAFQAIYGYVYQALAILIAAFMAGMALGSWMAMRRPSKTQSNGIPCRDMHLLFTLQTLAVLCPLLIYAFFDVVAAIKHPAGIFLVSHILFPVLAVVCGVLGGYQFPIASRVFFAGTGEKPTNIGALYALDLAGACIGAVVLTAYLVPIFGFLKTASLMAVVNLAPAVLAGFLAVAMDSHPE